MIRLALPLSLVLAGGAPSAAQVLETKRFGVGSFEHVEVRGDMIVDITPSNSISAVAEGTRDSLDTLTFEMRERTLVIRQSFEGPYGTRRPSAGAGGQVRIHLTAQNLASAALAGSGSVRVEGLRGPLIDLVVNGAGSMEASIADGTEVTSRAVGSGTITVSGRARTLTAVTNGAASINAAAFPVRDLTVRAAGSGASHFAASASANIIASGAAEVVVDGAPRCTAQNIGAGSVTCGSDVRNRLPRSSDAN